MRTSGVSVGPRGATLLVVAAVAGVLLAAHGWATRDSGLPVGALGGVSSAGPVSPGPGSARSTSPTGGGSAPGPLLSSESFASYSYKVWPGAPSPAAKSAMTGLSISVRKTGSGVSVSAGASGQQTAAHAYPGGAQVYVVEASMGDEAGTSDYNLGDDGVVVTDVHGRIVQ